MSKRAPRGIDANIRDDNEQKAHHQREGHHRHFHRNPPVELDQVSSLPRLLVVVGVDQKEQLNTRLDTTDTHKLDIHR